MQLGSCVTDQLLYRAKSRKFPMKPIRPVTPFNCDYARLRRSSESCSTQPRSLAPPGRRGFGEPSRSQSNCYPAICVFARTEITVPRDSGHARNSQRTVPRLLLVVPAKPVAVTRARNPSKGSRCIMPHVGLQSTLSSSQSRHVRLAVLWG